VLCKKGFPSSLN